ncbi:hypothetical protein [Alcanivorax sp.]|uniref:hypothetical protein n=1 Tax=Alcanivorax sp. TaxID=1872427 RepID=UPI0025C5F405|nr:hypothetical protein [Alcanivorax sp.]
MNTYKKVLPLAVAMALAACGGSDDTVPDQSEGGIPVDANGAPPAEYGTYARFNPVASDLPLNTDLVFADSTDGTADAGVPSNPVTAALNQLDGFSTSAYFDIAFAGGDDGGSLDPLSLCTLAVECEPDVSPNVFLVPLAIEGDALSPPEGVVPMPDVDALAETAISASAVSLDVEDDSVKNTLRITPLKPLLPATKYLVFITNGVKDSTGKPVVGSLKYKALGGPVTGSLGDAVKGWESLAAAVLTGDPTSQAAKDSLAISFTFTTTNPIAPLVAMAAPRAQGIPGALDNSTPVSRDVAVSVQTSLDIARLTGTDCAQPQPGQLPCEVGSLFTGQITLPYYQSAASKAVPFDPSYLAESWRPDTTLAGNIGATVPQDEDGSLNVTYRYPFAEEKTTESVPLQVTLPEPDYQPDFGGGATCSQLTAVPDNPISGGYPVALYIHGITSDRASVVALAHTLASQCVATVAIDLPVHGIAANSPFVSALNVEKVLIPEGAPGAGTLLYPALYGDAAPRERHFNVAQSETAQPVEMNFDAPTELDRSGAWFVNLGNLTNTRDNLRQAVMDLLNVNASLDAIAAQDLDDDADPGTLLFDKSKLYVVGHSLGSIVGSVFATVNEQARGLDGVDSNLNPIKGLVVSAGGSQLSQILNNSSTLGPTIKAGLAANGVEEGTTNYERFLYVAQSTVDSGDPVNFAQALGALDVPVLVQQIVGGGADESVSCDVPGGQLPLHTSDKVVPNEAEGAPLAGTTPLAMLLGDAAELVNLTIGHHASLLRPNECGDDGVAPTDLELLATGELQTEVVSFILSGGAATSVGTAGGGAAANFVETP